MIVPETIVCDHGKAYLSATFRAACRSLGISLAPAHPDTPTDKPVIERTLASVSTLFAQYVAGYAGRSTEHRGKDAEQAAMWSMAELQALLDEWIVAVWQNRPHERLRDPLSPELTGALDDPAAILYHPGGSKQHEQERLAAAASQPLARIARLYWPDPRYYLCDPEGFRQMLRPACRRCTARRGIAEPVACYLPPHRTVCRRHRLWIGPSARSHAGQLDVSQLPEILRAQRRHLAQLRDHPWQHVDTAVSYATRAIHQALRAGTWIPGQRQRLRQLDPGTWQQALAGALGVSPGRPDHSPGHPVVEIAIYPDVVWLAARSLRAHTVSHHAAP